MTGVIPSCPVFFVDSRGVVTSWSEGARVHLGYSEEQIVGRDFSILFDQKARKQGIPQHMLFRAAEEGSSNAEGWRLRRDHSRFWCSTIVTSVRSQGGGPLGYAIMTRERPEPRRSVGGLEDTRDGGGRRTNARTAELEATVVELRAEVERHRGVEAKLLESLAHCQGLSELREHLTTIVDRSCDAISAANTDGVFTSWNRGAERIYGYSARETIGESISILIPDNRSTEVDFVRERIARGACVYDFETERVRKDGTLVPVSLSIFPLSKHASGREAAIVARDLTTQRGAEAAVRLGDERLRKFLQRLLTVREEERANISREVHDVFGQTLTAIKLDARWIEHSVRGSRESQKEISERVEAIVSLVDGMVRATRALATELRPAILDQFGLISTIEWALRDFSLRTGIGTIFHVADKNVELDDAKATAAYRILQEALTNVARHARARQVLVDIVGDAANLALRIEDDGLGFPPAALYDVRSLGLIGMQERARLAGARLSVGRGQSGGTVVSLVFTATPDQEP